MTERTCMFCGTELQTGKGYGWCPNTKCWISRKKIPLKVWESVYLRVDSQNVPSLGTCVTCVHKECFGRINTGDGHVPVEFCSQYGLDTSIPAPTTLLSKVMENWSSIAFLKTKVMKMPLGWLIIFERLLAFASSEDSTTEIPFQVNSEAVDKK